MESDGFKKDDGLRGKYFLLQFDLDIEEDDKPQTEQNILTKSKYPNLLKPDNSGDLIGTEPKFFMEIADNNGQGLGEVVAHIAEVYIKLKQTKLHTEQIDFQLTELVDWVGVGKIRLMYRVEREEGENDPRDLGYHFIPTARLCSIIQAYFLNALSYQ